MSELLPLADAAGVLGVSVERVRQLALAPDRTGVRAKLTVGNGRTARRGSVPVIERDVER